MINVTFLRLFATAALGVGPVLVASAGFAQSLISPNGYSGIGLIPSARTLHAGEAVVDYSRALPGARAPKGHNFQVGFGLMDDLELVGKLATQDLNCNMFQAGACPPNTIRDFSASLKWRLPSDWLDHHNAAVALGATDVGGAATHFRSYYAVGTKSIDQIDLHVGFAQAKADQAILHGTFSGIDINPNNWSKLSLQNIGSNSWAHASVLSPITYGGVSVSAIYSMRLNQNTLTPKNWVGFAFNIPLDGVTPVGLPQKTVSNQIVRPIDPANLATELVRHGFYRPAISETESGLIKVSVNNTAYAWSSLDAAGVALGLIAGAYGDSSKAFELVVTTRGIPQLMVSGTAKCAKEWLNGGKKCEELQVQSLLTRGNDARPALKASGWLFRPELIISPVVTSAVGTEFGSLDFDIGASVNTVLPLWKGAIWDLNRIEPLDINTDDFRKNGTYFNSRLRSAVNRRMFHQVFSAPTINTQFRLSAGMAYTTWKGHQLESMTQNMEGRHRLSLAVGQFRNDTLVRNNQKDYHLATYRFANNAEHTIATEITYGKFWGGDTGYQILQRFWHGDTNVSAYLRRSQMQDGTPTASFAGLQFTIPLTPRRNIGYENFGLRGVNQWTYSLESRIFNRENLLTAGYGEIPRFGENLPQIFNRDRNGQSHLQEERWRMKNSFNQLSLE